MNIGSIQSLWHYPVKSIQGIQTDKLVINKRGIEGDRLYAIYNTEGKIGSGKNTRRFRHIDGLLSLTANQKDEHIYIHTAGGKKLNIHEPATHTELSNILGQAVTIQKENNINHLDDSPVHILTSASLNKLQQQLPDKGIDARRFRPNIVIDTDLEDKALIGKELDINGMRLEVTHMTERCRMVTMVQPKLSSEPKILKTLAQEYNVEFGVYAKVLAEGQVEKNNPVLLF